MVEMSDGLSANFVPKFNQNHQVRRVIRNALYKVNFDNYVSTRSLPGGGYLFFVDYLNQYVEVDARAFANLFTEAML